MKKSIVPAVLASMLIFAGGGAVVAMPSSGQQAGVLAKSESRQIKGPEAPVLIKDGKGSQVGKKHFTGKRKYRGGGHYKGRRYRGRHGHRRYYGKRYRRYGHYPYYYGGYNSCRSVARRCGFRHGWHSWRWRRCMRYHGCGGYGYYRGPGPFPFPFPFY